LGYRSEEVINKPLETLLPAELTESHIKNFDEFATSQPVSGEIYKKKSDVFGLHKDGTIFPAEASFSKFSFRGETIFTCTIRDISERKRGEEELERVASDLTRLIDTANVPIFVVDVEGRVNEWNRKIVEITGFTKDEVIGRHLVEDLINGGNKATVQELFDRALRGVETSNFELPLNTKEGRRVMVLLNTTTRRDASGDYVGVVGVGQDITERKHFEEKLAEKRVSLEAMVEQRTEELSKSLAKLEAANLQLRQANQHKGRFLSSMSHELRTPLNAILGFSDLLEGQHYGLLNEKQASYVEQIDESGKHLLSLITDLLDIAKIDAGRMDISLEAFSWNTLICSVASMMDPQFQDKRINLQVDVGKTLTKPIIGDQKLCKQILFNLLSNAVKFTPEGGMVTIGAVAKEGRVKVSVSDTGVGIPLDQQEGIFSEFHQLDCPSGRHQDGAGIGLALTRRLVELLGGEIGVESEPGRGSTFTFTLPIKVLSRSKRIKELPKEHEVIEAEASRRILVAEDNEVNLTMILDMLATRGHEVMVARNGKEAVEMASNLLPHLILMDIKMPVMDGLEATRRIKRAPELSGIPVIALTALADQESVERCLAAGCCDHLPKPVQSKELFAALTARLNTIYS
jgi:PAS domain S-box-containing protein